MKRVEIYFSIVFCCLTSLCSNTAIAQNNDENFNDDYTVFYYPNGNISSEGIMLEGKPDGYWKTYYENGNVQSEGNRKEFLLDSVWLFYDRDGIRTSEITYSGGKKSGESVIYKDGIASIVEFYDKNVLQGYTCHLYTNGEVWKKIPYVDGKESGEGYEYAEDGRIITLLQYKEGYLRSSEQINRKDKQGKKRGLWIDFHDNMMVKYEGTYMNDLKNGIFKSFDKKGDLKKIEKFRDGVLVTEEGDAVILDLRNTYYDNGKVKSTGGYVDNKKEGTHRIYDEDGNIISGVIYSRDETVAEGVIDENGLFQGMWKLYYPGGELKAEGEYTDSKRQGEWKFYHINGEIEHRGKYIDDLPQGEWKWYFDNGLLRREEFYRRGKEDGESIEYNIEKNVISKGEYINGLKEGEWFYNVGDHTQKGAYRDGEKTGDWRHEYTDGKVQFEGEFVADLPVGKHTWYYKNGQVKTEGKYNSGIKVGTWKSYNEEGLIELIIKFKKGEEFKINGKRVELSDETEEMVQ